MHRVDTYQANPYVGAAKRGLLSCKAAESVLLRRFD